VELVRRHPPPEDPHGRVKFVDHIVASDECFRREYSARSIATRGALDSTRSQRVDVETRKTVRLLTLRGLEPTEATNLTAYLCGIEVAECSWKLAEINWLLFLRELRRRGLFGPTDASRTAS
jgi:hypothetical protein